MFTGTTKKNPVGPAPPPLRSVCSGAARNLWRARLHKLIEKTGRATGKEREEALREEFRERTLVFVPEFRKYLGFGSIDLMLRASWLHG